MLGCSKTNSFHVINSLQKQSSPPKIWESYGMSKKNVIHNLVHKHFFWIINYKLHCTRTHIHPHNERNKARVIVLFGVYSRKTIFFFILKIKNFPNKYYKIWQLNGFMFTVRELPSQWNFSDRTSLLLVCPLIQTCTLTPENIYFFKTSHLEKPIFIQCLYYFAYAI